MTGQDPTTDPTPPQTPDEEGVKPPLPFLSPRGFLQYEPLGGEYGGEVRVYESSAASESQIWLNTTGDKPVLLSLEKAALLRDRLTFLIDHHYHNYDRNQLVTEYGLREKSYGDLS